MTEDEHAATGPGPGSGPRPSPGAGPRDAAPAADSASAGSGAGTGPDGPSAPVSGGAGGGSRAHGHAGARQEGSGTTGTSTRTADATAGESGTGVTGGAGAAPEPPPPFRRYRQYKLLGGVCAGLGRHCDMDPVIFRITLAVLSATGGIGLIFYGFAWLFVPYDDEEENELRKLLTGRVEGQALAAVLFALVGCGVFLTMLRNGGVLTFAVICSLLLAGAGYWSRQRGAPSPDPLATQAAADAPPEPKAPPVAATYPSWWRDPIVKDGTHVGGTGYLWGPRSSVHPDVAAAVNISGDGLPPGRLREDVPWTRPAPPPKPRVPRWLGGWVFLLALLAGLLGTRLTWEDHPLGTSLQTGLSSALVVLGAGIAISALLGRTGAGSMLMAIITAGLLAGAAALPKDIGTQWMRTDWQPTAVAQVRDHYDLGTGTGTLDLSRLRLPERQTVVTSAEVGLGRIRVIVPRDVTVRLTIDVGLGDIQLPGDRQKDVDVEPGKHQETTLPPVKGSKEAGTLDLDLRVGAGQVEVARAAA